MADNDDEWISRQTELSTRWLLSLPAGALGPTGQALRGHAESRTQAAARHLRPVHNSEQPGGGTGRKPERKRKKDHIQPPLMTDLDKT